MKIALLGATGMVSAGGLREELVFYVDRHIQSAVINRLGA
jgi:hypothetical protein